MFTYNKNAKPFVPNFLTPTIQPVPSSRHRIRPTSRPTRSYQLIAQSTNCKRQLRNDCWRSANLSRSDKPSDKYLMYLNDYYIDNSEYNPILGRRSNLHGSLFKDNIRTLHTSLEKPTAVKGEYIKCHYGYKTPSEMTPNFWCANRLPVDSVLSPEEKGLLYNGFESINRRLSGGYAMKSVKKTRKGKKTTK
jgi:hypothetical protein